MMEEFTFADRYAQAALSPAPEIIAARETVFATAKDDLDSAALLSLARLYLGLPSSHTDWFRDAFRQGDPSFSLLANAREAQVLAALLLENAIAEEISVAILVVLAGTAAGRRQPTEADWLIPYAKAQYLTCAIRHRAPRGINSSIKGQTAPKIAEQIATTANGDWAILPDVLTKMRAEANDSTRTIAAQTSLALSSLKKQYDYLYEETQILWWLFGQYSRTFERPFSAFTAGQAALLAGLELGQLSSSAKLGLPAATAMIGRVLQLVKKGRDKSASLAAIVDSFSDEDIDRVATVMDKDQVALFPIQAAIESRKAIGKGNWYQSYHKTVGLSAETDFAFEELGFQVYLEHLLGQLLR